MKLSSKVKVTRIVPETGEILEEVVSKTRFKKKSEWAILPKDARNEILSGAKPALLWDGDEPCPVETMQEIKLSGKVALEIWRIKRAHAGDHLVEPKDYIVKDLRGRMPRRSLPSSAAEEQLERPTKDVLDKARLDGSYTSSRSQSVPGTEDEVPEDYLTLLAGEGLYRSGQLRVDRRGGEDVRRLEAKRDEAVRLGKPGRATYLETKIEKRRPHEGG